MNILEKFEVSFKKINNIYERTNYSIVDENEWELLNIEDKFKKISHIIGEELDIEYYELDSLFSHDNPYSAYEMLVDSDYNFIKTHSKGFNSRIFLP